jgi:hypothetical protein
LAKSHTVCVRVQWALECAGLLDSKMASTSIVIGGLPLDSRRCLKEVGEICGIINEGVRITCREGKDITVKFEYVGVSR